MRLEPAFVAQTDFGKANASQPRWRVYARNPKREPWGHQGVIAISGYFWTVEEALEEMKRLSNDSQSWPDHLGPIGIMVLTWLILVAYLIS